MLKKFNDFVSEELHILKSKSSSGRTKEFDVILDEPTSNLSASAGLMLRHQLRKEELQEIHQILNYFECPISSDDKINFENATKLSNWKFLMDKKVENIELRCEYCNKGPLKIYGFSRKALKKGKFFSNFSTKDGATCDHKKPTSKGGSFFDYNNLAVCCIKCNKEKGNMSWEDWIKKMNIQE